MFWSKSFCNDFLKEVDSIALQQSLRHFDTAYQNFFRDHKIGFPKFKSKKDNHKSYTTVFVNGNIKLLDGYLILPKLKAIKIKQHRAIANYTSQNNDCIYNSIVTSTGRHITTQTLSELEEKLNSDIFIRSHKSYIINKKKIKKMLPYGRWTHIVQFDGIDEDALITSEKAKELENNISGD